MENSRFHRRAGNRKESNLTKYTSHPELQLSTPSHPRFQCRQCGFVNTLFPLCLCCTWTSKQAEHEFNSTMPRARRASAPAIVVKLYIKDKKDTRTPHDHHRRLVVSRSMSRFPPQVGIREEEETPASMRRRSLSNGDQNGDKLRSAIVSSEVVATATSSSPLVFAQAQATSQGENLTSRSEREFHSIPCSLPSEGQQTLSVDRHPAIMPPTRSSRNLRVRRSHQVLSISTHDSKMPSSSPGDDNDQDHIKNDNTQRSIRRRKHLNILQKPVPDTVATEPIAISLNIHRPSIELDTKVLEDRHPLSRSLSHPQSATSESSNGDPTTPPLVSTLLPPSPTTDPSSLVTFAPSSSPVRIGHPSRPYYSAIRKNGISPPPSRPSSVSGPSPSSPRPKSYTPPSSLPIPSTTNTTTSSTTRHLSMSSMFVSPALASPPGAFSAFSVMDDADLEDDDNDDNLPVLPPTPAPGRTRFSLSSPDKRRFSHGPLLTTPASGANVGPRLHNHSQSLSQARSKALGGSIGFSMSGETELRMALAMGAADSGGRATGFRFRETVVPTSVDSDADTPESHPRATRNGLMDKVKKLRQGLKDLLFTTSTTTSTTFTTA